MSNLLATGAAYLAQKRASHLSREVTYRRGEQELAISATPGRTTHVVTNDYGFPVQVESRDYIVTAADLTLDSERFLPSVGDRIEDTVGGYTYTCEILPFGENAHYRPSDAHGVTLRLFTKVISQVAA